jgi:hypothetical protein
LSSFDLIGRGFNSSWLHNAEAHGLNPWASLLEGAGLFSGSVSVEWIAQQPQHIGMPFIIMQQVQPAASMAAKASYPCGSDVA